MPLLLQLLEHDLHRAKNGIAASPLMIETPAKPGFVPALVSSSRAGTFIVARRLTQEGRLRSGVFAHDPDRVDDLLPVILREAYALSLKEKYKNIFTTAAAAFSYIHEASATGVHPHVLLVPMNWTPARIEKFLGKTMESKSGGVLYKDFCRVLNAAVDIPTFFSRPDYVGMYTQFLGGNASIFLHNVKQGLAFVTSKS